MRGAWRRLGVLAILGVILAGSAHANTRYDPRLRFRTISSARFDIHFHQGEETLARRLAAIAEEVASEVDASLGRPSGRVHVILVDQTDLSNGWATPLPYNVIEITAAGPPGGSAIGNTDDWLRVVFAHEYTHVVHLERGGGWIGGLRRVFGRLPLLYPNLFQPLWQIEGIATFEESALTGRGRLHAGDFRLIVDRAAMASRFEPLDRAGGGLIDWPSGQTPYAYGAFFHEFLGERYGRDAMRQLTDDTARRLPYLGAPAFTRVFGRSLGDLWNDYAARSRERAVSPSDVPRRLTRHGFTVAGPRFGPDGRLFYSVVNPHGFPALLAWSAEHDESQRISDRYLGERVGFAGPLVIFDQVELTANVGLQSDLYAVPALGGSVRRLTRGRRASDPDVAPDRETVVCTLQKPDRRELATLTLSRADGHSGGLHTLLSEPFTEFDAPRWSPDGRWIAVERRRTGQSSAIVLVDPGTAAVRPLVVSRDARLISPAWMPDGRLLFASDREPGGFRIFAVEPGTGTVTRLEGVEGTGAHSPDVSPDGAWLVFVGYTVDGDDLFRVPLASATWTTVDWPETAGSASRLEVEPAAGRPYQPLSSLMPRFWVPTLESDNDDVVIGAATGSSDALGRHLYAAEAGWTAKRARPDWQVAYAYDRWRPTLFTSVADDTDPFRDGEIQSTEAHLGLLVPFRRVRAAQTLLASLFASKDIARCDECGPRGTGRVDRRALRLGWRYDNARAFGYSISEAEGWTATVSAELTRRALGADADAGSAAVDVRSYVPVVPRHGVVAARIAGAWSWGENRLRREFSASGHGPAAGGIAFGSDAIGLMRGFDEDLVSGPHAAVVNLDYRVPLARIERGLGTLPLFVRTLHAAVFMDTGHAWDADFSFEDVRRSFGVELSLDVVLGYLWPVTVSSGVAWRDDPRGAGGAVVFGRIGRAF